MSKQIYTRTFLAALVIGLLIPGASIYLHYRADMKQAYQRISKIGRASCRERV